MSPCLLKQDRGRGSHGLVGDLAPLQQTYLQHLPHL